MSLILFLGYGKSQTKLIDELEARNCKVNFTGNEENNFRLLIYIPREKNHLLSPSTP